MSLPRKITIDTYDRREEGAYAVLIESYGQAPILLETEGCDSSFEQAVERRNRCTIGGQTRRWCIVRLVPVEGNELLLLDFERLQKFTTKKEGDE